MPRKKPSRNADVSAMAFLNYARQYHEAVEELFLNKRHLTRVLNALYFHVTELLLKAYLRAHNREPWGHEIVELYEECLRLGLKIPDDQLGLHNIVNLLKKGNEDMAFRYFTLKSGSEPELSWTREVLEKLMQVVATFVESQSTTASSAKGMKKMTIIWGKPVDK
jgi:HEPN domain-containing protein